MKWWWTNNDLVNGQKLIDSLRTEIDTLKVELKQVRQERDSFCARLDDMDAKCRQACIIDWDSLKPVSIERRAYDENPMGRTIISYLSDNGYEDMCFDISPERHIELVAEFSAWLKTKR